jgi:metal-dependent amidase/aminoacylase/carboxypeptidase family protein
MLKSGCTAKYIREAKAYSITSNSELEAEHILRLGKKFFGADNACQGIAPVYASEDFGEYTLVKPGAFFFLSSGK